jgi:hypothetical protein
VRTLCLVLISLPAAEVYAQDDFYYPVDSNWRFRLNFGFGIWESQHNLNEAGIGEFDEGPVTLEIGVDYRLSEWGNVDIYLGLDAGLLTTESDIPGQYTSPTSDAGYLLPSLALYFGNPESPRFNFRAGGGRYSVEFSEVVDYYNFNRNFSESAFGTFAGAGIDFPMGITRRNSITLDSRVHFVDFGEVEQLGPTAGTLEGPIWTVQLGWAFRF